MTEKSELISNTLINRDAKHENTKKINIILTNQINENTIKLKNINTQILIIQIIYPYVISLKI